MREAGGHRRKLLFWAAKILAAALLLTVLLRHLDARHLLEAASRANAPLLLAAVLLLLPNLATQYAKWALLLRRVRPDATSREVRNSLLLGFSLGLATPARVGEFGGRAAALHRDDAPQLMGLTAVDKFLTMIVTLVVGIAGTALFAARYPFVDAVALIVAALLAAAVLTAAVLLVLRARAASDSARLLPRLLRGVAEGMRSVDATTLRRALLLSVLFYLTFSAQFLLLLCAFGPCDLPGTVAGITVVMLVKTVIPPVTLGELGVREGASVLVFGLAGMSTAMAFNASLLLFVINLLLPALLGVPLLLRLRKRGLA
jgi:uncharacterized membrane protein YbhN (UPF0104 family)